jgi:hypothetical protein
MNRPTPSQEPAIGISLLPLILELCKQRPSSESTVARAQDARRMIPAPHKSETFHQLCYTGCSRREALLMRGGRNNDDGGVLIVL